MGSCHILASHAVTHHLGNALGNAFIGNDIRESKEFIGGGIDPMGFCLNNVQQQRDVNQ
ncbi:hypothetical protein SDC9_186856 [bioreactor metagenome]|uniref:Uncharacterized protein n=1 Tax=bioreactor metagenome TaxID=1076179 RepID=A0A645HJY3_9ZZZZ